jgi:hypothetical protein
MTLMERIKGWFGGNNTDNDSYGATNLDFANTADAGADAAGDMSDSGGSDDGGSDGGDFGD